MHVGIVSLTMLVATGLLPLAALPLTLSLSLAGLPSAFLSLTATGAGAKVPLSLISAEFALSAAFAFVLGSLVLVPTVATPRVPMVLFLGYIAALIILLVPRVRP